MLTEPNSQTGARFTEDLRIILSQFSHLRSPEDNDLIHRTLNDIP